MSYVFPGQNTIEEFEKASKVQYSLFISGGIVAGFFQEFTSRHPDTKWLSLKEGVNITAADIDFFLPHIARVEKLNTTVPDYPIEGIDLSPEAAFCVTPAELSRFNVVLQALVVPDSQLT